MPRIPARNHTAAVGTNIKDMNNFENIKQPPFTDKYRLLVDDMSNLGTFGVARQIDKILYNIKIIGDDFKIDQELHNVLSRKGLTSVFTLGRFIVVLKIRKDNTEGEMLFFDFEINDINLKNELFNFLKQNFSENIMNEFVKNSNMLNHFFTPEFDVFELFNPSLL